MRVVYMNLVVHPQVQMAHQYGCAAGKQGKFVEFKRTFWDKGFGPYAASSGKDKSALEAGNILAFAPGLGLDPKRLQADAESQACEQRVNDDMAELGKFHANGTPTFFINGHYLSGGLAKEELQELIDAQLAIAKASGVPARDYYAKEVLGKGEKQFVSKSGKRT